MPAPTTGMADTYQSVFRTGTPSTPRRTCSAAPGWLTRPGRPPNPSGHAPGVARPWSRRVAHAPQAQARAAGPPAAGRARSAPRRMPVDLAGVAPARAPRRPACPRWSAPSGGRRRRPRSRSAARRRRRVGLPAGRRHPAHAATPAAAPRRTLGARQNDEKSCSPMSGSQARRRPRRSSGWATCQVVAARNGSGTGPVQHRVAVAPRAGPRSGRRSRRAPTCGVAHHDRGPAQAVDASAASAARSSPSAGGVERDHLAPARARRRRCARRTVSSTGWRSTRSRAAASVPATVRTPGLAAKPWKPVPS